MFVFLHNSSNDAKKEENFARKKCFVYLNSLLFFSLSVYSKLRGGGKKRSRKGGIRWWRFGYWLKATWRFYAGDLRDVVDGC